MYIIVMPFVLKQRCFIILIFAQEYIIKEGNKIWGILPCKQIPADLEPVFNLAKQSINTSKWDPPQILNE